jgi:O-succinylbenzoate synthase
MRIDRVRTVSLTVPLVSPLQTSEGTHDSRRVHLVEITDADGVVGWGENVAPSGVNYVGETPAESERVMRDVLVPHLVSQDVNVHEMNPDTWWGVGGVPFAKHAVESGVWDVLARRMNMSFAEAIGAGSGPVEVGVVVGLHDTIDAVLEHVESRAAEGYRRIKLKIAPNKDIDVIREVRALLGDDFALQVDANGAYGHSDIDHLCSFDAFGLQLIEQPFAANDLASHAELARRSGTSVCLDESIMNMNDLQTALRLGACDVVNIKPSRVGGMGAALDMHDLVLDEGIDAWVGGMLESGIGRASCLALAAMPGFTLTPDLSASNRYFSTDITEPFVLTDGCLALPDGPGIGVTPLPEVLSWPETQIETLFER